MKKNILLVDDKKEFRTLVKMFLQGTYNVETAENGLNALSIMQQGFMPDLIVSDLMMPQVDGRTLLAQIRASSVFKHIPVIILSSMAKSSDKVQLFNIGASDYLTKPFSPEELRMRVQRLISTN